MPCMSAMTNPYQPDYADLDRLSSAPFAGRKTAFGRLYQQLNDPGSRRALLILGARRMGKTAFLHACDAAFGDAFVGVVVPMRDTTISSETEFFLALAQSVTETLAEREFSLTRLSDIHPPRNDGRLWWETEFLPQAFAIIRAHRKLALLLDDAERLINAVRAGTLPADTYTYLKRLLEETPALGLALTLDTEHEAEVPQLAPLVTLNDILRLPRLAPDETAALLREPAQGAYTVPDDAAAAIQKGTGGVPSLAQHYGYRLFSRWQATPDVNVLTVEDIKAVTGAVAQYGGDDFRYVWGRLPLNERLVLTAISGLVYDDPLKPVDADAIESWLVKTDYPLDVTAIRSALRGLEYRDVIQPVASGGTSAVTLVSSLWQTWLLENARLGAPRPSRPAPSSAPSTAAPEARAYFSRRTLTGLLVAAAALGGLTALLVFGGSPPPDALPTAPTVTLDSR